MPESGSMEQSLVKVKLEIIIMRPMQCPDDMTCTWSAEQDVLPLRGCDRISEINQFVDHSRPSGLVAPELWQ
jgi:hypothetical protein